MHLSNCSVSPLSTSILYLHFEPRMGWTWLHAENMSLTKIIIYNTLYRDTQPYSWLWITKRKTALSGYSANVPTPFWLEETFCLWDIWYQNNGMFANPADVDKGHQHALSCINVSFSFLLSPILCLTSSAEKNGKTAKFPNVSLWHDFGIYLDWYLPSPELNCDLKKCT